MADCASLQTVIDYIIITIITNASLISMPYWAFYGIRPNIYVRKI